MSSIHDPDSQAENLQAVEFHPPEKVLTKGECIWRTIVWLFSWLPGVSKPGPPPADFIDKVVADTAHLDSANLRIFDTPSTITIDSLKDAGRRVLTVVSLGKGDGVSVTTVDHADGASEASPISREFSSHITSSSSEIGNVGLADSPGIDPERPREKQEDRTFSVQVEWRGKTFELSGVADGHGGHLMAQYVKDNLGTVFAKHLAKESRLSDQAVARAFQATANELQDVAVEDKANYDSEIEKWCGTTLTATLITDDRVYSLNCGDSRTIAVGEQHHIPLTKDQSKKDGEFFDQFVPPHPKSAQRSEKTTKTGLVQEIFTWTNAKGETLTETTCFLNRWGKDLFIETREILDREPPHVCTRTSSADRKEIIEVRYCGIAAASEIGHTELFTLTEVGSIKRVPGMYLIHASDGLWDVAENAEVAKLVREMDKANHSTELMAFKLNEFALRRGSMDNTSVVVSKVT